LLKLELQKKISFTLSLRNVWHKILFRFCQCHHFELSVEKAFGSVTFEKLVVFILKASFNLSAIHARVQLYKKNETNYLATNHSFYLYNLSHYYNGVDGRRSSLKKSWRSSSKKIDARAQKNLEAQGLIFCKTRTWTRALVYSKPNSYSKCQKEIYVLVQFNK
jgi:hypothetical protein